MVYLIDFVRRLTFTYKPLLRWILDGRRYRGEWRNGMAHGRGTETYPNGAVRHDGQWVDDEPVR